MSLSVSFDRSSLSLGALVLPGAAPTTGLWVQTLGRPDRTWRRQRATSNSVHGASQTAAVLEQTGLPLTVGALASSAVALDALQTEFEAAVWQFTYDVTVTEDGVSKVWACDCADIKWNDHQWDMARQFIATATLTLPCYPLPGSA